MNKKHLNALLLAAAIATPVGLPVIAPWSTASVVRADDDLPDVPKDAKKVAESNTEATYKATARGQIWLYDVTTKDVVNSITLWPDNTYSFDAKEDKIFVNKTPGPESHLTTKHTYRLYYVDWSTRKQGASADEEETWVVPKGAKHVAQGKAGENVAFKAVAEGTAYLFDRTSGDLVNTFKMVKDDSLVAEPKKDGVYLNDKEIVKDAGLKKDHSYRLWFAAKAAS